MDCETIDAQSTSRARFAATMEHRQPSRVLFDLGSIYPMSWLRGQEGLAEYLGLEGEPRPVGAWGFDERIMDWAGSDFRGVGKIVDLPSPHTQTLSETAYIDCWGVRYEFIADEWQITGNPLSEVEEPEELDAFTFPEPRIDDALLERWAAEAKALRDKNQHVVLAEHPVYGVMELGCWMFGYENYLYNLLAEPDLIRRFNDRVLEIQLGVSRQYYKALGPFIDLTTSGDDFGMQDGTITSPETFETMIAPWFRERIKVTKDVAGCYYWHHSCGSIVDLLDTIIDCGVDILNPIQTSAAKMDPSELKKRFGDRIVFWGGMDVQQFLCKASPGEVRARAHELIGLLGADGGYVMAPAHEIARDVPLENIAAWVEAVRDSGNKAE